MIILIKKNCWELFLFEVLGLAVLYIVILIHASIPSSLDISPSLPVLTLCFVRFLTCPHLPRWAASLPVWAAATVPVYTRLQSVLLTQG